MRLVLVLFLAIFGAAKSYAVVAVKPSASEDLFPCNAGLMHTGQGLRGTDYVQVQYEDMNVPPDHPAHFRGQALESHPANSSYQILFSNSEIWSRRISALNFSFSSEKTGASYFIDFCYLGSLPDIRGNGGKQKDHSEGIYVLSSSLASANLTGETSYHDQVRLQAKVEFICDLRERGKILAPRSPGEIQPAVFETDNASYNDFYSISAGGLASEQALNTHPKQVPRFCRLRASFTESQIKDRGHDSANTEMTVLLNIQKVE